MDANNVVLVGRIAGDLKHTPKKGDVSARTSFMLACNRIGSEKADYIPVVCWGAVAESVAKFCAKGKEVAAIGNLRTNSTRKADGSYDNYWNVVASIVSFGRDSKKQQTTPAETSQELETDMAVLAAKLAAAKRAQKAKNAFNAAELRSKMLELGLSEEEADEQVKAYADQNGLSLQTAEPPAEEAPAEEAAPIAEEQPAGADAPF